MKKWLCAMIFLCGHQVHAQTTLRLNIENEEQSIKVIDAMTLKSVNLVYVGLHKRLVTLDQDLGYLKNSLFKLENLEETSLSREEIKKRIMGLEAYTKKTEKIVIQWIAKMNELKEISPCEDEVRIERRTVKTVELMRKIMQQLKQINATL